jgi:hypothetical protein
VSEGNEAARGAPSLTLFDVARLDQKKSLVFKNV